MALKSKLFCTLFILAFFNLPAQEDRKFTSLSTKDGLSSNIVRTILKDQFGLLWFGTDDGLDKFDGSHVKIYRHKKGDSTSLQSNEILSLHEDKKGNLWVGTSGGSVSLYDRKKDVFINFPAGPGPNAISHNVIRDICSDYLGNIWIIHFGGVDILDPVTKKNQPLTLRKNIPASTPYANGMCAFEDSKHRMWIGTTGGLFLYTAKTRTVSEYLYSKDDPQSLPDWTVNDITEDKDGNIWIATNGGLSLLKKDESRFINFSKNTVPQLSTNLIYSVAADNGQLWLGTNAGLEILDNKTLKTKKFSTNSRDIYSLTAKEVLKVYIDNEGICWLGMFRGGVNKFDKNLNLFNFIKHNPFDGQGLNASIVSAFVEDNKGNVFVGTDGGGLSLFNTNTKLFTHLTIKSKRTDFADRLTILSMAMNNHNQLMIGTYSDGLFLFDPVTKNYQQWLKGNTSTDLNSSDIFCIKKDRSGQMWVGTNGDGVNVLDHNNKVIVKYTPYPKFPNDILLPLNGYIRDIEEDDDGNIWIATHGGGIAFLQPSTGKFTVYNSWSSKLPNDKILSLLKDRQGNIWAGTSGSGLVIFKKGTRAFDFISETDKLENNTIYTILEDQQGLIWVSTNKGISSIDYNTRGINNYNYHNGVQNNNFVQKAGIKLLSGEIFFGGLEGINYFNPRYLRKNNNIPAVLITDLRIANQSVIPSEDGAITEHISIAKEIHLDYKQNFALSFVGLNFTSPEQNKYAYKLQGFDGDWNYVGNATSASYTNLDPGEYTFRVKASNNNGVWNDTGAAIKIFVHPPFWRKTYAYLLYVILLISLLLFLRYRSIKKLKKEFAARQLKSQLEQEKKEAEKIHELDMLKIKFLTNLSHEFRTPISLILGPVETLIGNQNNSPLLLQLNMIKRNGKRLLNLVNQLLDFRKMEEQELTLQSKDGELVSFVKEVFDSFQDLAERKKIGFFFSSNTNSFYTVFDHDKIERILFNLLSNAFKFTHQDGVINVEIIEQRQTSDADNNTWFCIKVKDTGIGIPNDKRDAIFERFFQHTTVASILNQGSGIGLSITKEFIKMHGGTITVDSELEKGSTFTLLLPFKKLSTPATPALEEQVIAAAPPQEELLQLPEEIEEITTTDNKPTTVLPSILLVEDNDDFRLYLKENLQSRYKVYEAANGLEGWQKALSVHPKLIVSDIGMPHMDGIEFCKKIKADKRTSHIPVILLTAYTGERNQIQGLKTGANDYITKPFNFEVLTAKIKNQLILNDTLKNTYSKQVEILSPKLDVESSSEILIHKIVQYVEENLTDTQLSVENLSRHLGMSRSTLYSKLLEFTGETPIEYIRSVKLNKAAQLLERSDMNIAEIAYTVGFATPNYFAKAFKLKFNMLPSEYMQKTRKTGKGNAENNS
jgi:signal transduction histidine kinase/ligand-binding sensor domain-containing protein/DNA-binding response OmpR family regulator